MRSRSPFPGMDPYLEKYWRDVHASLCVYARDALQPQIQPALFATIDERLVVEAEERPNRSVYPDVTITAQGPWPMSGGVATVGVAEPLILEDEPRTEGFIHIIEPEGGRLVTVIEFLSPTNKLPGDGQDEYLQKRREYRDAGINLVEVDLLRRGARIFLPRRELPPEYRTTYQACVRRAVRGRKEIYAAPLRRALPAIAIPLRKGDADAHLDLQAIIEQTYRNGAYGRRIDYTKPPDPPLDGTDAAWAEELLRAEAPRG